MADHPLRPATRRCLGRPLPYQLADRTRARLRTPTSMERSAFTPSRGRDVVLPGISSTFAELFPIRRWVTHALLTRAPLYFPEQARDFSYDLHVLCTPPAFILSQDQTLHLNSMDLVILFLLVRPTTASLFSFQRTNDRPLTSNPFLSGWPFQRQKVKVTDASLPVKNYFQVF